MENRRLIQLNPDYVYLHSKVCTKHFTPEDLGPNKIVKDGIGKLFG